MWSVGKTNQDGMSHNIDFKVYKVVIRKKKRDEKTIKISASIIKNHKGVS